MCMMIAHFSMWLKAICSHTSTAYGVWRTALASIPILFICPLPRINSPDGVNGACSVGYSLNANKQYIITRRGRC